MTEKTRKIAKNDAIFMNNDPNKLQKDEGKKSRRIKRRENDEKIDGKNDGEMKK
jgi:hypothetical protein